VPTSTITVLADLEILTGLHLLPDGAALTTDEAAIFLRVSKTTLERMRREGGGPVYIQGGLKGAKGVNHKVTYIKCDLITHQQANKVGNSMQAAVRRGQAYLPYVDPTPRRSPFDLITKRPFYVDANGQLTGCVDETPVGIVIARLGASKYLWLNPIHAAQMAWASGSDFAEFAGGVKLALHVAIDAIDAASEARPG
jgi:glucose/arabinose dehydrogenase